MEVLRGKRKPMTAAEIYAEIRERELAPGLKGKTPEQTVAAQLAVQRSAVCASSAPSRASSGSSGGRDRRRQRDPSSFSASSDATSSARFEVASLVQNGRADGTGGAHLARREAYRIGAGPRIRAGAGASEPRVTIERERP
jgi:hypothetical protein